MKNKWSKVPETSRASQVVLKIVVGYAFIGMLWILFSHRILSLFIYDAPTVNRLLSIEIKEWIPLFVSGVALYFLICHNLKNLEREKNFI